MLALVSVPSRGNDFSNEAFGEFSALVEKFPSPRGEMILQTLIDYIYSEVPTGEFPSPRGEMILQTQKKGGHEDDQIRVSVPSRGNDSSNKHMSNLKDARVKAGFPSPRGEMILQTN